MINDDTKFGTFTVYGKGVVDDSVGGRRSGDTKECRVCKEFSNIVNILKNLQFGGHLGQPFLNFSYMQMPYYTTNGLFRSLGPKNILLHTEITSLVSIL